MKDDVRSLIHKTSAWCAGLGVALSPIPLVDEIALFPVYSVFSSRIGKRHGLAWGQLPWRPILKSTFAGLVARGAVNVTMAFIPGVSAVTSGATAAALTEILGEYYDGACADPSAARTLEVKEVVGMIKRAVLKKKGEAAAAEPVTAT